MVEVRVAWIDEELLQTRWRQIELVVEAVVVEAAAAVDVLQQTVAFPALAWLASPRTKRTVKFCYQRNCWTMTQLADELLGLRA